jgi:hypothetical protein
MATGRLLVLAACALALLGAAPPALRLREGQVWEYRTRAGDDGSLLKIQKIDTAAAFAKAGPVYHVSIIGVHFGDPQRADALQHAPFTRAALAASVTRLATAQAVFPDAAEGIAEWRKARGGVFTITVAKAIDGVAQTLRQQDQAKR